ncbi:UDP-4-amino-4,6-dideoxy-N-acetyl-beta-L-altrosamine transaminase [Aestuariibacter halophilus]|uniref:UDP-4-amino-4, 6-dideoxy-N-acetyl-beta-L-altrosamine transaminase n=1 Tax=Fluctibacter halophilus TaxID=226011 RepID=A0ABS8G3E7_9ALTE|nr:UDP-4-amino-4,6-dideoxy-N-acetyl-beta-L-altrosamine transaminase [Aestuariibacter halophilus]MCC2615104.1 UDP-4-amino-4,6-dideoxy-N-acetyl-beta-L-altrosamine transaminase [Aestuariibacter halophilus]
MSDSQLPQIPYGRHVVDEDDVAAVVDVLCNQFLTQGLQVPAFEQRLCEYTGAAHAVAVNSGTSGLHIACLAAGVGAGDTVWTVPNSFVASANAARYCGADVDFVDIDPLSRNICVAALATKLDWAKQHNAVPKVLIVVHFSGASCDMQGIRALTEPHGIVLIEDAAHALGGRYQSKPIGSCQYSDMTVLSFHPVKSITTAEGGAVLTNRPQWAEQLVLFAKHGVTRDPKHMEGESDGDWYYQQVALGYNYRLSDIQAALGLSQMNKLDHFIQERRQLAARYDAALQNMAVQRPLMNEGSAWHLYTIELREHDRKTVFEGLRNKGIGVNVHYIPIHLQPYYRKLGFKPGQFPHAEDYYHRAITLPLFPGLSADEQDRVIQALEEVLS